MTTKKPRTGGEIDSWCTKCRLDLTHRIIAMVGDEVKRVECKTCGSHHNYRAPKSERESKAAQKVAARAERESKAPASGGAKSGERLSSAARAERDAVIAWEKAIAGQPISAFKSYRVNLVLSEGELVRHPKFGDGVVAKVIDQGKVEILFKDGPRMMAHGQPLA